jgi:hypothetical protein
MYEDPSQLARLAYVDAARIPGSALTMPDIGRNGRTKDQRVRRALCSMSNFLSTSPYCNHTWHNAQAKQYAPPGWALSTCPQRTCFGAPKIVNKRALCLDSMLGASPPRRTMCSPDGLVVTSCIPVVLAPMLRCDKSWANTQILVHRHVRKS